MGILPSISLGQDFTQWWMQTVLCDIHIALNFLILEVVFKSPPHKINEV